MKNFKEWFLLVLITALIGFNAVVIFISYRGLISKEESVNYQWSQVENVYQRRSDLIPNLVKIIKNHTDFEELTLTSVIDAHFKVIQFNVYHKNLTPDMLEKFQVNQDRLSQALLRLMVKVEKYPNLKSNQNFMDIQSQLKETENRIAIERINYNEIAQNYNTYRRVFPTVIISSMFGFLEKPYFKAEINEK